MFYTAEMVEGRLIEAEQTLHRMGDREKMWLIRSMQSSHPDVVRTRWDYADTDAPPPRIVPSNAEVDGLMETLGWVAFATPSQRLVIKCALLDRVRGGSGVRWTRYKRQLKWKKISDATVKRQYWRGLEAIAGALNAAKLAA